jgi:esterase/lipase superfamily enzyme
VPVIPVLFTWPSRGELRLRAYTYDRESANYSRDALESLLSTLSTYPSITEVSMLAHSMGNWVALEALRGRSIRSGQTTAFIKADTLKNVLLVAPDVDVDVFRMQIQRMGAVRPHIAHLYLRTTTPSVYLRQSGVMFLDWAISTPSRSRIEPNLDATRY